MARAGYVTVAIPQKLMDQVDQEIATSKHSYTSRAELIKQAIRTQLQQQKST
jgi:metal-responsive CopG/Arc/MetJ family transcriptional regulator